MRSAHISPSGKRAVFDYRGDIVTVPEEFGDPVNLTNSPGVHENYPAWSPDGKHIAYFSDASGEYELHINTPDYKNNVKKIKIDGTGFYAFPYWSPDSKKISFSDFESNHYLLINQIMKIVLFHSKISILQSDIILITYLYYYCQIFLILFLILHII